MDKGTLVGETKPRASGKNHVVDATRIHESNFERGDGAAFMFCSSCDSYFELSQNEIRELEKRLGQQISLPGEYVEIYGCRQCGGYTDQAEIKEAPLH